MEYNEETIQRMRAASLSANRCRLGWSQQRLADYVGVNVKSVKRWEAAKPGYNVPDEVLDFVGRELVGMCIKARNAIIEAEKAGSPVIVDCYVHRPSDTMSSDEVAERNAYERIKADYAEAKGYRVRWSMF